MFKNNDIYYLLRDPNKNYNIRKNINNEVKNIRNINNKLPIIRNVDNYENVRKIRRSVNVYDYIIISNNNYKDILKDLSNDLFIMILEKNDHDDKNILPNNIDIRYNHEMLSIEKYIHYEYAYCVFENKKGINYFSKNIIIANDSIKSNVIMNNITKEESDEFNRLQQIKEENDYMMNQTNYKTIKYYVRSSSDNCVTNDYIFSNTPNGKSINNTLVLEKGNYYIFEMTSDSCPFHINASYLHNIVFNIDSNKYIYVNNASILKGQTIKFFIPNNYNKLIFYFSYINRNNKFIKKNRFKLVSKKKMNNMYLTYN